MERKQVGFTENDAKRIRAATKGWENRPGQPTTPKRKRGGGRDGFWAKITGQDATDKWKYSWKMLEVQDLGESTDVLAENNNFLQGTWEEDETKDSYAVEINKSEFVIKNDIVWMMPSIVEPYYFFNYSPGMKLAKIVSAGTISARSDDTPGSGNVELEELIWNDGTASISTPEESLKVYSNFQSEIEGEGGEDMYLQITYSESNKAWFVTGVDCNQGDST